MKEEWMGLLNKTAGVFLFFNLIKQKSKIEEKLNF